MKELRPASADEMVLAFLQAEIDSPRFGAALTGHARINSWSTHNLLRSADLNSVQQNADRRALLGALRGYGRDESLFPGFPADVTWRWVSVTPAEIAQFKYANWPDWERLTQGTRRVADGVKSLHTVLVPARPDVNVPAVATRVRNGEKLAPLIAVEDGGGVVLVKGQTRATAYVLINAPATVDVILGRSANIREWKFY